MMMVISESVSAIRNYKTNILKIDADLSCCSYGTSREKKRRFSSFLGVLCWPQMNILIAMIDLVSIFTDSHAVNLNSYV